MRTQIDLSDPLLRGIIQAGIAAPSADNQLRVRFDVRSPRDIRLVGQDTQHRLPVQARLLHLMSFGAIVENMCLCANALGMMTRLEWIEGPACSRTVLDLKFEDGDPLRDRRSDAIALRHTNRALLFRPPGLSSQEKEAVAASANADGAFMLTWLDDRVQRGMISRIARIAETQRFRRQELHEELFSCVRFDIGWDASTIDGLPPGALGVEKLLRLPFRLISSWNVMKLLTTIGVHHGLGFRSAGLPIRLAPNVAALSTSLPWPEAAFEGGRTVQRIWLDFTLRGVAVQVFAAPALYANHHNTDVRIELRQLLRNLWASILPEDHVPLMVFRLGRAREPSVRALRPTIEEMLA